MPDSAASTWQTIERTAWEDQFEKPDEEQLIAHVTNPQLRNVFQLTRERINGLGEMREQLLWTGLPWCWAYCYQPADLPEVEPSPEPGVVPGFWAYLSPMPEYTMLVIPTTPETIQKIPMRRIKRAVRDGVTKGRRIGHDRIWAEWPLNAKTQLEDTMDIVKRLYKLRHETK